jgi:hypothetical protein
MPREYIPAEGRSIRAIPHTGGQIPTAGTPKTGRLVEIGVKTKRNYGNAGAIGVTQIPPASSSSDSVMTVVSIFPGLSMIC